LSVLTNYKKSSTTQVKSEDPPKPKITKTRGYMSGQKMTSSQMEKEVIRLSKTHKIFEIADITGKNRRTIERFLKKAKEAGKILTSSSGRITFPGEELAKRAYDKLSKDDLYEKYQPIKTWVDRRRAEAKGSKTKLKRLQSQLGKIKVVCDTLRLNPYVMLSAGEDGTSYGGLTNVMSAFSIAMTEGKIVYLRKSQKQPDPENIAGPFREHLMACRSFSSYNGVAIPKLPPDHILSGKKVGFGQYAHIRMSFKQINSCVESLKKQFGVDSFEVASFVFYYLTGTRNKSLFPIKTASCEVAENGWITCRVYESKQFTTWKKFIPNDNPHYEIMQNWIEKRKQQHKPYLFSEDGTATEGFVKNLLNNFKGIYEENGLVEEYFVGHAIHCLRHVAAHYWLDRTGLSHGAVAKIVGWKDVQTLIQCYGEITDNQIFKIATRGALHNG